MSAATLARCKSHLPGPGRWPYHCTTMQLSQLRRWWPLAKIVLAVVILTAIGWQFARDLGHEGLRGLVWRPEWLGLSGFLYLCGLGFSAWFWHRLLVTFGEKPGLPTSIRAYYISQLGKYLPGKAWALMMRGTLVRGPDVKLGVALIATFYEVLTMMASGALVAAVLLAIDPPALIEGPWVGAAMGVGVLAVCGAPLLPGVFNRLVGRLAKRFESVESFRLPQLRSATLLEGLGTTAWVWLFFGLSLAAMVTGLLPDAPDLTWRLAGRYVAIMALAYVVGFVAVFVPGGVGVREWVLDRFLGPELGVPGATVAIVIALRLTWTAAEVVLAAVVWWLPGPRRNAA